MKAAVNRRRNGIFSARVGALSRAVRLEMIERNEVLSISGQCALLSISRSSVYYKSRGESAENAPYVQLLGLPARVNRGIRFALHGATNGQT